MRDPLFDEESAFTIKLRRFYTFTVSCHNTMRVVFKKLSESILQALMCLEGSWLYNKFCKIHLLCHFPVGIALLLEQYARLVGSEKKGDLLWLMCHASFMYHFYFVY